MYVYGATSMCAASILRNDTEITSCKLEYFQSQNNCVIKSLESTVLISNTKPISLDSGGFDSSLPVHTIHGTDKSITAGVHRLNPTKNLNLRCKSSSFFVNKIFYKKGEEIVVNITTNQEILHSDFSEFQTYMTLLGNNRKIMDEHVESIEKFGNPQMLQIASRASELNAKLPIISSSTSNKLQTYVMPIFAIMGGLMSAILVIKCVWDPLKKIICFVKCTSICKRRPDAITTKKVADNRTEI